jgi:sterol desaturase/sphingolipid hydroxylase (fatty acid hydroxylase superfamily)
MGTLVDSILGSGVNYVSLAVPFFFLLIGIEFVAGVVQHKRLYRFNDSINDLSCGIIDQTVGVFLKTGLFAGYLYLFEHWRLFNIAQASAVVKWFAAIALVFGVDLCFYWFHRIAHEYAAPWATHVVHHQSEEYNLTVALRQSAFESCFAWVFYLPLAVIGFPPAWYLSMSALNLLYQFWIHTEAIGKLGPLEWMMNTPSHHRVHHARNPRYLDKNYAGMFIIWDRMFGTFVPEDEEPVYGLTKPLASWNPLWANLHAWVELAHDSWRAPRWRDKLKIWFMPLGWTPPGIPQGPRAQPITRGTLKKYDPQLPLALNLYVIVHFVITLVCSVWVLDLADAKAPLASLVVPVTLVLWSLANLGGILECKSWAMASELLRLASLPALATWWFEPQATSLPPIATVATLAGASVLCLLNQRGAFRPAQDATSTEMPTYRGSSA